MSEFGKGLCFRCEHRARFLEVQNGPRCECGDVKLAVYSCYMYQPVVPFVLEANEGDDRPIGAPWMVAPRCHAIEVYKDCTLKLRMLKKGFLLYWDIQEVCDVQKD